MKKILAAVLTVGMTLTISVAAIAADFRNANWGMTKKEVIVSEKKTPNANEDNIIGYEDTINGKTCVIVYIFENDKLHTAGYRILTNHTNYNLYIGEYGEFRDLLIKKYGEPVVTNEDWSNDLFKDGPQNYGTAVALGYLGLSSVWQTEKTNVAVTLDGDNCELKLMIMYRDKNYEQKEDTANL